MPDNLGNKVFRYNLVVIQGLGTLAIF